LLFSNQPSSLHIFNFVLVGVISFFRMAQCHAVGPLSDSERHTVLQRPTDVAAIARGVFPGALKVRFGLSTTLEQELEHNSP
jgi:hypothetical protein